jgi:glycosyltransferase involved in cell wall biosynthesis
MPVRFSVVVCAYNPSEEILGRTLGAVSRCVSDFGSDAECVVVDNSSSPPILDRPVLASALRDSPRVRVVVEERQGLSFARLRGVAETSGEVIVFFDDDNEPSATYLREVDRVFREHPQVGVFGPGNVDVEFLGHVPPWVESSCRHFFQERQSIVTEYACLRTPWHAVYPPGTGQSVRRVVMERYATRVAEGACTATDRKGGSLSSGGDGQIVHTAVSMGYAAGICPELRVRHLIPESRCTVEYLSRLSYGVTAALLPAAVESFPELRACGEYAPPSRLRYQRDKWLAAIREPMHEVAPLRRIHSAARVGDAVGRYLAAGLPVPAWLVREKQRLMVD